MGIIFHANTPRDVCSKSNCIVDDDDKREKHIKRNKNLKSNKRVRKLKPLTRINRHLLQVLGFKLR